MVASATIVLSGEKMSKYKKCKLLNKIIIARPGEILTCYGHKWIVQPDGTAIADIHVDFHEVEVKSGRYVVLENQSESELKHKPKIEIEHKSYDHLLTGFTMDIQTYYGCENIDYLKKRLGYLNKDIIQNFAKSRLNITLPDSMRKDEMIAEIINIVEDRTNYIDISESFDINEID